MDYQTILYDFGGGIGVITLNRPEKMNALTSQMRAEIADAVQRATREARVVVITGAGRAFCTGQDLGDSGCAAAADFERVLRDEYEPMIRAIAEAKVPVIAAVNGPAAGAGANLALACDVVIAAESAYFLQAFAKIGLLPDAGGTFTLPRRIGMARAMGAALFAERVSAAQAVDWGLIWEAFPDESFEAGWRGRAEHLATGPTVAFGAIKEAMQASLGNSFDDQLSLEARLQGRCGGTRDFKEGVLAFLEKRPAAFEGR